MLVGTRGRSPNATAIVCGDGDGTCTGDGVDMADGLSCSRPTCEVGNRPVRPFDIPCARMSEQLSEQQQHKNIVGTLLQPSSNCSMMWMTSFLANVSSAALSPRKSRSATPISSISLPLRSAPLAPPPIPGPPPPPPPPPPYTGVYDATGAGAGAGAGAGSAAGL